MPGYLIKTANFVAEISNDDELIHLAEVDTIKKDTQICALPGKTWVEAKKIPILRKTWGLDAGLSVPPPIAASAQKSIPAINSVPAIKSVPPAPPVKTKLPPSLQTTVTQNPLLEYAADRDEVWETEENERIQIISDVAVCSDSPSGCTESVEQCQMLSSEILLPIDEEEDESQDLRAISRASESSLTFDLDKIQELSTVSHTWELGDGTSTKDLPPTEVEREARELSMQNLDDLSGIELEAVGEETVAVKRSDIPGISELEDDDEESNASPEIFEMLHNISKDEYIEAAPHEKTYVIESSSVEKLPEKAPVEPGLNPAECPSIEIDLEQVEESADSVADDEEFEESECGDRTEKFGSGFLNDVGWQSSASDAEDSDENYDKTDVQIQAKHESTAQISVLEMADDVLSKSDSEGVVPSDDDAYAPTETSNAAVSRDADIPDDTSDNSEKDSNKIELNEAAHRRGYTTLPGIGGVSSTGNQAIRPFASVMNQLSEAMLPIKDAVLASASDKSAEHSDAPAIVTQPTDEDVETDDLKVLINLDAQQQQAESSFDVSGAFDIAQCKIPIEETHVLLPTSELNIPDEIVNDAHTSDGVCSQSGDGVPAADESALELTHSRTDTSRSYKQAPSGDDIDDMFTGVAPKYAAENAQGLYKEMSTEPFLKASAVSEAETETLSWKRAEQFSSVQQNDSVCDESSQTKSRIRLKRISHRSRGTRSSVTNIKDLERERRFPEHDSVDEFQAQNKTGTELNHGGYEEDNVDYQNEFEIAREAVKAAIRAASMNGGVDELVLRKAVSFVDALESSPVHNNEQKTANNRRQKNDDDDDDENPSDIFRIRSRKDLDLGMKQDLAVHHISETSPTFRRLPSSDFGADECLAFLDDDSSSERFKVRGRSELRRLLEADDKDAVLDSLQAMNVSAEDLCRTSGGGLRKMFEKQDELHLFLGNGVREKESEYALRHDADPTQSDKAPVNPDVTADSVTTGMPKRNNCVVAAPAERKVAEPTKVLSAYSDDDYENECANEAVHKFIDDKLYDGETRIMDFDSLHLTSMRVFYVEIKKGAVTNYEAFDIEAIQSFGIHEESKLGLLLADISLIVLVSVLLFMLRNIYCLIILIYLGVMLPICYVISFRKTVQFNCSGRVIRSRCGITRDNRAKAMEFLNRVDATRQERRHHLTGK